MLSSHTVVRYPSWRFKVVSLAKWKVNLHYGGSPKPRSGANCHLKSNEVHRCRFPFSHKVIVIITHTTTLDRCDTVKWAGIKCKLNSSHYIFTDFRLIVWCTCQKSNQIISRKNKVKQIWSVSGFNSNSNIVQFVSNMSIKSPDFTERAFSIIPRSTITVLFF